MQPLTNLNPVKHFAVLRRGVMLAWRFRKQLN
jgi:hypothetical protein